MEKNIRDNCPTPKVAIIIPVYNCGSTLEVCLPGIRLVSKLHNWELIVVDDASTDNSGHIAERFGAQVIKLSQNRGVASARNMGVKATNADILIFVDADIVPQPGTLEEMIKVLKLRSDVHAVGAYPLPIDLSTYWSSHFVGLRSAWGYQWKKGESERRFSCLQSECGAIRKAIFEELGGFSEQYRDVGMEEFKLGHNMEKHGYCNLLIRNAQYKHYYRTLRRRELNLIERTARWVPLFLQRRKFESPGAVGTLLATLSCLLTFIVTAGLISGIFIPWLWVFAGFIWIIQIIVEWSFLHFAYKIYGWPMVLYSLIALQTMHLSIGLGFAKGLVSLFKRDLTLSTKKDFK